MGKYVDHGKNKMVSSYGGVGSILETIDNSVLIETFDKWGYRNVNLEKYIIKDDRLWRRLQSRFEQLRHIVRIPDFRHEDRDSYELYPTASYFPKWFYCSKCDKLDKYQNWKLHWTGAGKDIEKFYPPKCSNSDCRDNILEQVRFAMTCPDGHLDDLPWEHWTTYAEDDSSDETVLSDSNNEETIPTSGIRLDYSNPKGCCDKPELRYKISKENSELSGIRILCKNPGCKNGKKGRSLKGIFNFRKKCFGKRYWLGPGDNRENCHGGDIDPKIKNSEMKVVIKSSNSVYYSNTLSSIYIPIKQSSLNNGIRILIERWLDRGKSHEDIAKDLEMDYDIPKKETLAFLKTGDERNVTENEFRKEEYDFMTSQNEPYFEIPYLKFSKIELQGRIDGYESLIRLDRLKQTTVQVSFTRQEPLDIDSVLIKDDETTEYAVKRQSTSINSINTTILPGVESLGEGLLFILDSGQLADWYEKKEVVQRIESIKHNALNSERKYLRNKSNEITPQLILIHTLSHILIKELEYICGYPAASIRERLYVGDNMNGFMIMAIEGSEGSLGGLVSQSNDLNNLNSIILSALQRAQDCSSDPVCFHSEGQGVNNLNLAACHTCCLLPETSCEQFNVFLDRQLLVNTDYGYFKETLKQIDHKMMQESERI